MLLSSYNSTSQNGPVDDDDYGDCVTTILACKSTYTLLQ